jgi:hypothetical protein
MISLTRTHRQRFCHFLCGCLREHPDRVRDRDVLGTHIQEGLPSNSADLPFWQRFPPPGVNSNFQISNALLLTLIDCLALSLSLSLSLH